MQTVAITAERRESTGKRASKDARKEGKVPCVLYGGKENIYFNVTPLAVRELIYTPDFKTAEVTVDGETYKCILKDAQFHPVTDNVEHIDFLLLVPKHPIKLQVPVRTKGTAAGVRKGGKLQQLMRKVKIKTTPEEMIDHLTVDITSLDLGQSARIRDIKVPEGIEIMNPMATPIAIIEIPRALRSAASAEAKLAKK